MKNRGIIFLLLGFGVGTSTIFSETKNDHEIFAKWIDWQRVFSDGDVSTMAGRLNAQYVTSFSKKYTKHAARIKPLVPFFTRWTEGFVDQEGSLKLQQNFSPDGSLFASLEHNPADFITKPTKKSKRLK
jgi:hypothetical protein